MCFGVEESSMAMGSIFMSMRNVFWLWEKSVACLWEKSVFWPMEKRVACLKEKSVLTMGKVYREMLVMGKTLGNVFFMYMEGKCNILKEIFAIYRRDQISLNNFFSFLPRRTYNCNKKTMSTSVTVCHDINHCTNTHI